MNTPTITQEGERLSFYKLFSELRYRIVIPIIQREYAQGRTGEDATEVRSLFLNALYNYLEEGTSFHDLDFIYGNLSTDERGTCFIPLDGQQRLTTLFLLHRYLCLISNDETLKQEYCGYLVHNGKSQFTYQTRQSASDFCDALMTHDIDINNLLKDENGKESVSLTIKNAYWFFRSWSFDPTVCAMLVMLDAIHEKFQGKGDYFRRLISLDAPVITFMFMELKKYRLTDELYIKMNSRGKQLTSFENFKAQYGRYLEDLKTEREFKLTFNGKETFLTLKKYFSHCIDTRWADLIWGYRNLDGEKNYNQFDQKIANLIRTVFTFYYASIDFNSLNFKYLREKELPSFNRYRELGVLSVESALLLVDVFDILYAQLGDSGKLRKLLPEDHPFDENKAFENSLRYKFENYGEQMCFYAYLRYLIIYGNNDGLADWMRVVYNLSHPNNTITNTQEEFASGIKSIDTLLPRADDIINYLAADGKVIYFSTWQVKEEKIKACLFTRGENWRNAIWKVERHGYFTGQIGFMLAFAGIAEFYRLHSNCNWCDAEDTAFFASFTDYAMKASAVFAHSYDDRINDKDYCFERAVLTKGDYLPNASANRKNLLSSCSSKNNIPRDYSWRRLLRVDDSAYQQKQLYVKAVFDDPRFNVLQPVKSMENICKDGAPELWRNVFIRQPQLFEYSQQGFIVFDYDSLMLLKESRMSHYHVELYTYSLWVNQLMNEVLPPFNDKWYNELRHADDYPGIILKGCYNKIYYQILITAELNNKSVESQEGITNDYNLKNFVVTFYKLKGHNKSIDNYTPEIIELLESKGFEWSDQYIGFCKSVKSESGVIRLLRNISIALS